MAVTSARDSSDTDSDTHFTSSNEDRITTETVPMLTPNNVISLPKGQAFALIEGGQLYKIRLPLPKGDDGLPKDLDAIATDMESSYSSQTPVDWYKAQDSGWYNTGLWGDANHG